jgi:hypothetical protein
MPLTPGVAILRLFGNYEGFPDPPLGFSETEEELKDIYENTTISFDILYQLVYPGLLEGDPVTNVTTKIDLVSYTTDVSGLSATKVSDQVIRVSGTPSDIFTDGFYKVLLKDKKTLKEIKNDAGEEFLTIVQWAIPSIKIKEFTHNVTVKITNLDDASFDNDSNVLIQTAYWKYDAAATTFRNLLDRSDI